MFYFLTYVLLLFPIITVELHSLSLTSFSFVLMVRVPFLYVYKPYFILLYFLTWIYLVLTNTCTSVLSVVSSGTSISEPFYWAYRIELSKSITHSTTNLFPFHATMHPYQKKYWKIQNSSHTFQVHLGQLMIPILHAAHQQQNDNLHKIAKVVLAQIVLLAVPSISGSSMSSVVGMD